MKYLLVADPHLGLYNDSDLWLRVTLNLYQSIIDTCKRRNINKIIVLGDFFDERKYISIKTLNVALKIGKILNEVQTYLILGNHDTFYKDRLLPSSLELFEKYENIEVIHKKYVLDDILLLPWNVDPPVDQDKYSAVLGHFAINSFATNDTFIYNVAGGTEPSDFQKAKKVYSGHFHNPMKKGNIMYLGSPFQQRFGDSDVPRGYYILENSEVELIEFTDAPKFYKIFTKDKLDKKKIEGNFIKLVYSKDHGKIQNNKILENVQLLKPLVLYTDFSKMGNTSIKDSVQEDDVKLKDNSEIMNEYISKSILPDHINEKTLKAIINNLMVSEE